MLGQQGLAVLGELDAIQATTGQRPWACPWWSFSDPDVRAVLRCADWDESGQLETRIGRDPPLWILLGVEHYRRVLERVRESSRRQAKQERAQQPPRAKPRRGHVVVHENKG